MGQCTKHGVNIKRVRLSHIADAATACGQNVEIIVNCTGLGAYALGGVEDTAMIPIRGQVAVVSQNSSFMTCVSGTEGFEDELTYAMTRAAGGGTIVGGSYTVVAFGDMAERAVPDEAQTRRILQRWHHVDSAAQNKGPVTILGHHVGFRPSRAGSVRLELEGRGLQQIVHCYGHGGFGYQTSWGCAEEVHRIVVDLASEIQ